MRGFLPPPFAGPATLGDLVERGWADVLHDDRFAPVAAARVERALRDCARALSGVARNTPAAALFVPGRIEVLGKHTDYAGGRSLVCAVDRGFTAVVVAREDRRAVVRDARGGLHADLVVDSELPASPGHWTDYVRTVVRRLARDFDHATGFDLAFSSDLPAAAGLSTSSALTIVILLGMAITGGLDDDARWAACVPDAAALAGYAAAVENGLAFGPLRGGGGVGTLGGSQDHCAILCARPGALVRLSFAPVRFEGTVALPGDRTFVVASSGVRAEKSAAARARYNRLARLAAEAAALWRDQSGRPDPHLGAAVEAGHGQDVLRTLREVGRVDLYERAGQFIEEAGSLIPAAHDALARGDLSGFGDLVARSQELAETALRNQVGETISLVRDARQLGAAAASGFGAGFGGSVWALVHAKRAGAFADAWRRSYLERFPRHADRAVFFPTPAGAPAIRIA